MVEEDSTPGPLLETYSHPGSGFRRYSFRAMGTINALLLAEGGEARGRRLDAIAQETIGLFEHLEATLSKFLEESEVGLVNALAAVRPVEVGPEFAFLLERARDAWEATEGAFDPTVGPLLEAWGFTGGPGELPSDEAVERLRDLCGMDKVLFDPEESSVRFLRPGMSLDFGGIAKGYAVDVAVERLQATGIERGAVISGRSSLKVWGLPEGETAWRIEIVHPEDPASAAAELEMAPGALSASGVYERAFERGGRLYGHVLDPRSGRPVEARPSVTVWTASALLGDVLSTALLVLGPEAVSEEGAAGRLFARFEPQAESASLSAAFLERDPAVWGGLKPVLRHLGAGGLRLMA